MSLAFYIILIFRTSFDQCALINLKQLFNLFIFIVVLHVHNQEVTTPKTMQHVFQKATFKTTVN